METFTEGRTVTESPQASGSELALLVDGAVRNWTEMCPDLLARIFMHLPLKQKLLCIPLVCRPWKLASENPLCWQILDFTDANLDMPASPRLIEFLLCRSSGRLLEIDARCLRDRPCLDVLACSAPLLQRLCIPDSDIDDEWVLCAAPLMPLLQEVDISLCEVSHLALETFGKNCKSIVKLKRNMSFHMQCPIDNVEAFAIAKHFPLLEHLELEANPLSAEGLAAIFNGCRQLEYLELGRCRNVIDMDDRMLNNCMTKLKYFGHPCTRDDHCLDYIGMSDSDMDGDYVHYMDAYHHDMYIFDMEDNWYDDMYTLDVENYYVSSSDGEYVI